MKKLIIDAVSNGPVSFLTLAKIPGFSGDESLELHTESGSNIILWFNCSSEAIQALKELKQAELIEYRTVSPKEYFLLGFMPKVRSVISVRHYKEPRWFPVAVAAGPQLR